MQIKLYGKIKKGATIIEGSPGFGLVGTIATEYLIDHLNAKQVGNLWSEKLPAIVAVHGGEIIEPFAIFYDEKRNIVILRSIATVAGLEWELADSALKLFKKIEAKELICVEGVGGMEKVSEPKVYHLSANKEQKRKLEAIGLKQLNEGIIIGSAASFLSKVKEALLIFAESYSELPDSRAAAKIIEVLDKYLGLDVDYKPLIEKADKFERKVRELLSKSAMVKKDQDGKEGESYFG